MGRKRRGSEVAWNLLDVHEGSAPVAVTDLGQSGVSREDAEGGVLLADDELCHRRVGERER